ncbi:WD40-repeat-containing domain protein [Kockovaella imperatae]|uniref:methylated diphthine methylhydrolase n=1 Tax=Kockovaella imperatae TaxID=4999 RepID=A0A1Y1UEQ1_9TREE|nr:WD40-repeat-containing domain protein [Kockovaella imperatae]ORX36502.1 WD40-repeat-containing domain protein [Kockovaella imperatae]
MPSTVSSQEDGLDTVVQARSLVRIDTEFSADCIEWCTSAGYEDIFICGTYQVLEQGDDRQTRASQPDADLDRGEDSDVTLQSVEHDEDESDLDPSIKPSTHRTGRLLLFQVTDPSTGSITEVQRLETNAILDAKWFAEARGPELLVADAKGQINIYTLTRDKQLRLEQTVQVGDPSVLVLSLDINTASSARAEVAFSLSDGALGILSRTSANGWAVENTWKGHDFEPWCIAWDKWSAHTVWSGGDDLKLKRWDTRSTSFPTYTDKSFSAGITTLTSSPHTPYLLAVGSYDEYLRLYDTRQPRNPLSEVHVGGGVWRARFHPDVMRRRDEMLLATMHDGFKVIKLHAARHDAAEPLFVPLEDPSWTQVPTIVKRFDGHESLAYGADWSRLPSAAGETLIATCSFYDHTMHLWRG